MQAAGTTSKEEFILKFDLKKDLKRLLVVCLASVLMALNIKSFVRTGGLYPGGATGLSLLIQRRGTDVSGTCSALHGDQCDLECHSYLHRFPLYREKIYPCTPVCVLY